MSTPQTAETSLGRARSNANLIRFEPGPDPRRANSSNAGASTLEWWNRLTNSKISDEELAVIAAGNGKVEHTKRLAAEWLLRMHEEGYAKNGTPFAANDVDRFFDRLIGRPKQHVEVVQQEIKDPRAMTLDLLHMLAEHPELRQVMANELAGLLPQAEAPEDPPGAPKEDAGEG